MSRLVHALGWLAPAALFGLAVTEVDFLAQGGSTGRHDTTTTLFEKDKLASAESCGGVETWTVPAAQIGASFLVTAQATVFDPLSSRVWVPAN